MLTRGTFVIENTSSNVLDICSKALDFEIHGIQNLIPLIY